VKQDHTYPYPSTASDLTWTPIPLLPGYEASETGEIRNARTRRLRRLSVHPHGYLRVTISGKTWRVHRLIAATFLGPCPARSENMLHAGRLGRLGKTPLRGSRNGRAKLTDAAMLLLEQLFYLREWSDTELARAFGVSRSRVNKIPLRRFGPLPGDLQTGGAMGGEEEGEAAHRISLAMTEVRRDDE